MPRLEVPVKNLRRSTIFSGPRELFNLLTTAVADGGLTARSRIEVIAREADDLFITLPAYAALMAWGREGLDMIVEIALAHQTVKSKSAALSLFSVAALEGKISAPPMASLMPEDFEVLINSKIEPASMKREANHALRALILSLPTDDLMIPVSQSVMHLTLRPEAVEMLVAALGAKWLRFGPPALDEYLRLLTESAQNEAAFQSFFCRYPQMLDPMAVQVWSQPDFHGVLEPDFVIRRADDSYLVIEIECPAKLLMTKGGQLSREATHAEKQAVEYESFLSERIEEARRHFPAYRRADCLVIVGTEGTLDQKQMEALARANHRRQNIRIAGFDWLEFRARALIENVSQGTVEVFDRHRLV